MTPLPDQTPAGDETPTPATSAAADRSGPKGGAATVPAPPDLSGVAEIVEVMHRLRSPGGCPWDAEQTHASLARYAVEEAHELADAIDGLDLAATHAAPDTEGATAPAPTDAESSRVTARAHLKEELGDLLLQVVFHARVAQEDATDPFDLDDVARGIAAKLRRRHPHVFADTVVGGTADVELNWEAIKAQEKPERTTPIDGVPVSLPPLERATALVGRLERQGALALVRPLTGGDDLGSRLLALVLEAREAGEDPSAALRATLRRLEADVRAAYPSRP